MSLLVVEELEKAFGSRRAVDRVSFQIEPGEVFGLLGPNGAGKTTTISMIATLLPPDGGRVTLAGTTFSDAWAYKRKLGYVPQEIALEERLTARENLRLFGRLYDLSGAALRARVEEELARVGLVERGDDLVRTFSGGMKRRLNIAAALLHDPLLVLMDEPTAGVDPQARVHIFELVERLAAQGRAILYTTHYMEEAQRLCRRTAIIDHGRILAMGTLPELTSGASAARDLVIEARGVNDGAARRIAEELGGASFTIRDDVMRLTLHEPRPSLSRVAQLAEAAGLSPTAIRVEEPNLETVFLELTGRALRE